MRWQKKARVSVAIFGIVFAAVVYFAIGERETVATAPRPSRLDPRAILETIGSKVQQLRLAHQDYVVEADKQLSYEDGSTKLFGVRIRVPDRDGKDFFVTAREAQAGPDQKELKLEGDVKLQASDGFEVTTDQASFNDEDAMVVAPGLVSFRKGQMSGSGMGMSYDKDNDILSLDEMSHVQVTAGDGTVRMEFTSGSAILARIENILTLDGGVHALRGEQMIEASRSTATLTEMEEHITFIELRGDARVAGGGTFDSMSARDIDLDYSDDGTLLERVVLNGDGAIAMTGQNGSKGRQFLGDTLDLRFAPDESLTRAEGHGKVRVDLPGAIGSPARSVTAGSFDASGVPGKGLTQSRFAEDVEYREEAGRGGAPRTAKSRTLVIGLAQDTVTGAAFTGAVTFEEQGLKASGAEAIYDPAKGTLNVRGADGGGSPSVSDSQVTIEADAINVALQGRTMSAAGNLKTTLRPRTANASNSPQGGTTTSDNGRLPGLLQQGQPANVNGNSLDYQGAAGKAVYSGNAALWQGETAIRADTLTVDQQSGDLIARGNAKSTLMLDMSVTIGSAAEIRYEDAARQISYNPPPTPAGVPVPAAAQPHLSGPQGDVRADRIEVQLAKGEDRADRLEAYGNVNVRIDTRVATGARLTYFAGDERYVLSGAPNVGVTVVDGCRETTGKTLTFFKSTDRIIVDGNEELRTQTRRGATGPCPEPRTR